MRIPIYLLLFALTGLVGCSGLKLSEAEVNRKPPDDWQTRSFMRNTADFRFHLTENVGLVVTPTDDGKYQVIRQPIVPDGYKPREDIIKDGAVYRSIITQKASAKGGYLAFAAGLSASDAVEYTITDVSRTDIPWTRFPEAKIRAAATTPNPSHNKRLWIQSLILSRIVSTTSTIVDCNGEAAAPAFKIGTTCHTESGQTSNDFGIGAVFLDIDKWVKDNPKASTHPSSEVPFTFITPGRVSDVYMLSSHGRNSRDAIPDYISVQSLPGELIEFRGKQ